MFLLVVVALAGASPAPPPPAIALATAALTRAVDDVERRTPAKDDATRTILTRVRKLTKDPTSTPASLAIAADEVGALAPDVENVQIAVLDALTALAPTDPAAVHARIRARAVGFVQRNPASTAGHLLLASALAAQGDEEGQLRALAACGEKCKALFLEAQKRWQRSRCTGDGIAAGLTLRLARDRVASARDVAFIEPIPGVPGVPATTSVPAVPGTPAQCLVQLKPAAAARLPRPDAALGAGLFMLNGIVLVSDTLRGGTSPGSVIGPAVVCARLCKRPAPRALPPDLVPVAPAP